MCLIIFFYSITIFVFININDCWWNISWYWMPQMTNIQRTIEGDLWACNTLGDDAGIVITVVGLRPVNQTPWELQRRNCQENRCIEQLRNKTFRKCQNDFPVSSYMLISNLIQKKYLLAWLILLVTHTYM